MPKFELVGPDGKKYDVEAPDVQQAVKDLNAYRQDQMNQSYIRQAEEMHPALHPFMAVTDFGKVAQNALTGNWAAKGWDALLGTGDQKQLEFKAAANRMGFAGKMGEAAAIMGAMPSVVPRVAAAVGGGPATRLATSVGVGGLEGGIIGGVRAAGEDDPNKVGASTAIGGVTGMLGPTLGNIVNRGARMFNEKVLGKSYEAPPYRITQPGPNPDTRRLVNVANTKAEIAAAKETDPIAKQDAYIREFGKVPDKGMKPAEREALDRLVNRDFGTRATGGLGTYVGDKMVGPLALGGGIAGGIKGGGVIPSLLASGVTAATATGTGRLLKEASLGGTKEAARDLRRLMYGKPEFVGPVSDAAKARFGNLMRQYFEDYTNE